MAVGPAPTVRVRAPAPRGDRAASGDGALARPLSPLVIVGASVALCLFALSGSARRYNDTRSYFHLDFTGAGRLPVVPLLYSTLSASTAIVVVQAIIAGLSWGWLAYEVQGLFARTSSRLVAAVGIVFVGTSAAVSSWNGALLSESVSISLLVTVGAALLHLTWQPTGSSALILFVLGSLWLLCRQQNVFLGLVAVAVATPFVLWGGNRTVRTVLVGSAILCFVVVPFALRNEQVRTMNLAQVVSARVLTDPSAREWWYEHGLPRHSCVEQQVGQFPDCLTHDRRLQAWLERDGATTYARWLATRPLDTLLRPLVYGLAPQVQSRMQQERDEPALLFSSSPYAPSRLDGVDLLAEPGFGQLLLALVALGLAVQVTRRRRLTHAEVVSIALFLVALAWLYPSWLGAGFELVRVTVSSAVLAKVALVLGAVALLDATARPGTERSGDLPR